MTCRVVLAEDNAALRQSLKMALTLREDLIIRGEAEDGLELLDLVNRSPAPDLAIVDIRMPRLGGIDAIREIRKTNLNIKLLVLTMYREESFLSQAFVAGADGYLLKEDLARELSPSIDALLAGKCYVSRKFAREAPDAWLNAFIARKASSSPDSLSQDDAEFLDLLALGESSSDLADRMFVPTGAVTAHRAEIMRKLHLSNGGWVQGNAI